MAWKFISQQDVSLEKGEPPLNELRKRLFDCYDEHYLRGNALTHSSLNASSYQQYMAHYEASFGRIVSQLPQESRVVDIGCGLGFLLFWLEHRRPGILRLTGVDISESQLALAGKHLPDSVALCQEEASTFLKRNASSFAAIFCTDLLEHMETEDDLLGLLELAKRSLVPGGLMICQVPNMANLTSMQLRYIDITHRRGFTRLSLLQLLECAGFRECQIVRRKAVDATQWMRMLLENSFHRAIYRICGVANEQDFQRALIGMGKA